MPRPTFPIGGLAHPVEFAAGVRFELGHDSLGESLGLNDGVHMVGPDIGSHQVPAALRAMPLDRPQYDFSARWTEEIGILEHGSTFCCDPLCIRLQHTATGQVVVAVH
jgi:hypothetical protein